MHCGARSAHPFWDAKSLNLSKLSLATYWASVNNDQLQAIRYSSRAGAIRHGVRTGTMKLKILLGKAALCACALFTPLHVNAQDCPNIQLSSLPDGSGGVPYYQQIHAGVWTNAEPASGSRISPTATLLPNGKVLLMGGMTVHTGSLTNGGMTISWLRPSGSAELYDPSTGTWEATASAVGSYYRHTATLLFNGKVLVTAGYGAELYDPASETWSSAGQLPIYQWSPTATLLADGRVLTVGSTFRYSYNDQGVIYYYEECFGNIYDPASNTWTTTGPLNAIRKGHTATLLPNGKVLVAGSIDGEVALSSAELYDPATGGWTPTGSLNIRRGGHMATLLDNGKVLVISGKNATLGNFERINAALNSAELYDPATGLWTMTGSLGAARTKSTATRLPDGKVLVAGGYSAEIYMSSIATAEVYDPAAGTWVNMPSLITPRQEFVAALLPNGKVMVAGGVSANYGSIHLPASAELYDLARPAEPYTFAVTSGALPGGLTLSSNGILSGSPSTLTTNAFSVTMTDANGCTASRDYSLAIRYPNIKVNYYFWTLPAIELGIFNNFTNTANGGTAPYTFTTTNTLPEGLTLSTNGVLSGTISTNYNWPNEIAVPIPWEVVNDDGSGEGGFNYGFRPADATGMPSHIYYYVKAVDANGYVGYSAFPALSITPVDPYPPTVLITTPVAEVTVVTATNTAGADAFAADLRAEMDSQPVTNASFRISGTAKSRTGIEKVNCSVNGQEETAGTVNSFKDWSAVVTLKRGTNIVTAQGVDRLGRVSNLKRKAVIYIEPTPFTLSVNGSGDVISTPAKFGTPVNGAALGIDMRYTVTAVPRVGYLFLNWTGTINTNVAKLSFTMKEGMSLTANFVPNPFLAATGKYNGLFHEAGGITHQTAGFFSITLRDTSAFGGTLVLDGDRIAFTGKFNADGTVTKTISRAKQGKIGLTLALNLVGTDKMNGTISGPGWTADLDADKAVFSALNPAIAYANYHTMLLPGFADPAAGPAGYSFGRATISLIGGVKINGTTADGITLSQSTPISGSGKFPLYVPLYKSTKVYPSGAINRNYHLGSMLGWLTFTNNAPTGTVSWIKTIGSTSLFPNGFTNESAWFGSRYVAPAIGTPAVDFVTGTITLTNGNLSSALTRNVSVNTNNILTITPTNQTVRLTLSPSKGLLSGSFKHPDNANLVTPIKGVVLQEQKIGGGFFIGTNQGGLMLLQGD